MRLLSVHNVSFSWGYKPILNKLSFTLNQGQTVGIAGPNGTGKSTLLNIICGKNALDEGHISLGPQVRFATVSQEADFGSATRVSDYLLADIRRHQAEVTRLEEQLANTSDNSALQQLLQQFGDAQDAFLAAGGYQAEDQAGRLLTRTGLAVTMDQQLSTLSGGERSVLTIVQALVSDPDILILDEPGNHLDYAGLEWLETFLRELDKGIILVSHNRYLLDRCADTIVYLEAGRHWVHTGSYSQFRQMREEELATERKEWAARERELHQLNIELKDLQHQASQSCNPPVRIMIALGETKKKIARLREIHDRGRTPLARNISIRLKTEALKGESALELRDISLSFGDRKVLDGVSFKLKRGDRAALVGLNGCGKSSLIRLIREQASWDNPKIRLAPAMKTGYLSQQTPFTDMSRSLIEEVRTWGPLSIDAAFNLISPFAFPWEELEKPLSALSGGELQRLQLALLTYRQVNFLILDEPSNHLDIPSRETLESCLADFAGTMLIVSHDRYLIDSFATRILQLENGRIHEHEGNFSTFLDERLSPLRNANRNRASGILNRDTFAPSKAGKTPDVTRGSPAAIPPEERIAQLEAEIARTEQAIIEALGTNDALAQRLEAGLLPKQKELEKCYLEWV